MPMANRRLKSIPGGAAQTGKKSEPVALDFSAPDQAVGSGPGEYSIMITEAVVTWRKGKHVAMLSALTDADQLVRMYVTIPQPLQPGCRYLELCALALGEPLKPGASLDPHSVFVGKWFRAFIGWRKSEEPDGRGIKEGAEAERLARTGPKDAKDYMRIHDLLERLDG